MNCNIFISSTFKDMDAERDIIVGALKPAIERALKFNHVNAEIRIVDLRWGVNTQDVPENERENKVLSECLDFIRESRPFFIGFVGGRYGWIPPKERWDAVVDSMNDEERLMMGDDISDVRSVTELEMLFGVLKDPDSLPSSFFFLRDDSVYDSIDPERRATYLDSDPACVHKLTALRDKIRNTYSSHDLPGNVIDYSCAWDGKSMQVDEKAILSIVNPIVRSILDEVTVNESTETYLDDLIRADKQTVQKRCSYFAGREAVLSEILGHVDSGNHPVILRGKAGSGKTSLLCRIADLASDTEDWLPLVHFGAHRGPDAFTEIMLKKFLWQIPGAQHLSRPMNIEAHPALLAEHLRNVALQNPGRQLLLLIDNAEYIQGLGMALRAIEGIPNVSAIITTGCSGIDYFENERNAVYVDIPPFEHEETLQMIGQYMALTHKSLPAEVTSEIIARTAPDGSPAYSLPQWTISVLDRLVSLDSEDFARLRGMDGIPEAEKITRYLCKTVAETPIESGELSRKVLHLEPYPQKALYDYMYCKSFRTVQAMMLMVKLKDRDTFEYLSCESVRSEAKKEAPKHSWKELEEVFAAPDSFAEFDHKWNEYQSEPSPDSMFLLCAAYYRLVCNGYPKPAALDEAFNRMNTLRGKNLLSLAADASYYAFKENQAAGDETLALHYSALREKCNWLLYIMNPASSYLKFWYAASLDDNSGRYLSRGRTAKKQQEYINIGLEHNALAIRLFEELHNDGASAKTIKDLAMAKVHRIVLLSSKGKYMEGLQECDSIIPTLQKHISSPGIKRQLANALDYKASILGSMERLEESVKTSVEAYNLFVSCLNDDSGNVEIVHSLATVLDNALEKIAYSGNQPNEGMVENMLHWATLPLESNPDDLRALDLTMRAMVLDLYFKVNRNDLEGIVDLADAATNLAAIVAKQSSNTRSIRTHLLFPALECLIANLPAEKSAHVASRYKALRVMLGAV